MKDTTLAERAFNALGDPMRRRIFEKLRSGELPVGDIAEGLPVTRPAVSQHLKVLKAAKLIRITKRGTRNICAIDADGVIAMRFYLDNLWDVALKAFKSEAEQVEKLKNQ